MPNLIKINLPETKEQYETGNGEGVWAIVDNECKIAYEADEYGTQYIGILDNDSILYPHMVHGYGVIIEMRGTHKPVVPYDYLNNLDSYIEKLNNEIIQNSTNEQHIPDNKWHIDRLNDWQSNDDFIYPLSVLGNGFFMLAYRFEDDWFLG